MYGEVVDIQYRNSEPTKEQPQGLPHTFVTYKVLEVLRGKAPDEMLILRIPGGADGQGGIYMETSTPTFARNQTDVLFIQGGEVQGCPLVACIEGRFRVHNNQVFNAWGVPVVDAKEDLRVGGRPRFELNVMDIPRPSFEALMQRPEARQIIEQESKSTAQSLEALQKRYEQESPEFYTVGYGFESQIVAQDLIKEPEAEPIEKYDSPLSPAAFFESIRNWSDRVGDPKASVVMANPEKRFMIPDPRAVGISVIQTSEAEVSEEERKDEQAKEGTQLIRDISPQLRELSPDLRDLSPQLRELSPDLKE